MPLGLGTGLGKSASNGAVFGGDSVLPTLSSATVNSAGTQITLNFSEEVLVGTGAVPTISASSGIVTLTYVSGSGGTSFEYSTSRIIAQSETVTVSYTQAGSGIQDLAGNLLATFSGSGVTNNSTHVASYLYLAANSGVLESDGSTAENTDAVTAWTSRGWFDSPTNVASGNPTFSSASPYVVFSGSARGMHAAIARYMYSVPVPDASGQDAVAGKGFTNTGLYRNADGTWWMGNDGRARGSATFYPSLVKVSSDLTTKLQEILLKPLFPSIGTVQGVVVANDGSLWFCSGDENLVRNVSTAGVSLGSISLTAPNGLAYDKTNNRLIVGFNGNVRTYNPATGAEVAVLPTTAGIDHMHWLSNGDILGTTGNNGSVGDILHLRSGASSWRRWTSVPSSLAIEGVWYDETESRLYVSNDEYFHNDLTSVNKTNVYDVPVRYTSQFEVHAKIKLASSRSKTECIMALGEPVANPGFGMFALSTGNTTLRMFINTGAGTTNRTQLNVTVSDLSVESLIRVRVNLDTKTLSIWQNGTLISSSLSLSACGSSILMSIVGIGSNPEDSSQNCAVSVKGLRITPALTDSEASQVASEMP